MKTALTFLAVVCMLASCSRSGTTLASDDTAVNSQIQKTVADSRYPTNYPISEKELTVEVRTDFYSRYFGGHNTEWYRLADGTFKALFFLGKTKWQVIYTPDGRVLSETQI
ncbi:MAG: hypothetical protein WCF67_20725 [Chitinophagaceae bacterium]